MTGYGWLNKRSDITREGWWFGVHLQPDLPTRWEEFDFARAVARASTEGARALDAGTGVTAHQHILPMILGNEGWYVVAIDSDPSTLNMPAHPCVLRMHLDMLYTPFANGSFDAIFSISTLEHCTPEERETFIHEADRLLAPEGVLCMTFDDLDPQWFVDLLKPLGYDCGEFKPIQGEHLLPSVSYVVAKKP